VLNNVKMRKRAHLTCSVLDNLEGQISFKVARHNLHKSIRIPLASNTSCSLRMSFTTSNFRHPHHYAFRNFDPPNVAMRCGVATYTTIVTPNCRNIIFAMILVFPHIRVFSVRSFKRVSFIFWIHSKSHGSLRDTL